MRTLNAEAQTEAAASEPASAALAEQVLSIETLPILIVTIAATNKTTNITSKRGAIWPDKLLPFLNCLFLINQEKNRLPPYRD